MPDSRNNPKAQPAPAKDGKDAHCPHPGVYAVSPAQGGGCLRMTIESKTSSPPEDQVVLRTKILQALQVLLNLNEMKNSHAEAYAEELRNIALIGLTGTVAQTETASQQLEEFKRSIVDTDGQTVKNRQATLVFQMALFYSAISLCLYYLIKTTYPAEGLGKLLFQAGLSEGDVILLRSFTFLWGGAMLGTWISFVWRSPKISFNDLSRVRPGYVNAQIRLTFAGMQTLVVGMLMHLQVIAFKLGLLDTSEIGTRSLVAMVVGALCGYSEQALPLIIAGKAKALTDPAKALTDTGEPKPEDSKGLSFYKRNIAARLPKLLQFGESPTPKPGGVLPRSPKDAGGSGSE